MTTTWAISIDWNRDGTYTDEISYVISTGFNCLLGYDF